MSPTGLSELELEEPPAHPAAAIAAAASTAHVIGSISPPLLQRNSRRGRIGLARAGLRASCGREREPGLSACDETSTGSAAAPQARGRCRAHGGSGSGGVIPAERRRLPEPLPRFDPRCAHSRIAWRWRLAVQEAPCLGTGVAPAGAANERRRRARSRPRRTGAQSSPSASFVARLQSAPALCKGEELLYPPALPGRNLCYLAQSQAGDLTCWFAGGGGSRSRLLLASKGERGTDTASGISS
jgi:hypothetical protein